MLHRRFHQILAVLLLVLLAACAGDKDTKEVAEKPAEVLYNEALDKLKADEPKEAVKLFEEVERQHPYSVWASRAQIMAAYAQYQQLDYDAATAALDRFIQLHPGNPQIAYAYYLRALCYYERIPDVRRDQSNTKQAQQALSDVISRFPETSYARDAVAKQSLIADQLAGAEMEVGRYYLKQKLYESALGRFQTVISQYQRTSHVPEALLRLVECYLALGVRDEAKAVAAVLGHNFPGSDWYQDAYQLMGGQIDTAENSDQSSWISSVWNSVF